jgi:hypothetical protein
MSVIHETNGFRARKALERAANDPRVAEIEGGGMDPGRVFVWLAPGFWFRAPYRCSGMSAGSAKDLRYLMGMIEPRTCTEDSVEVRS